MKFEDVSVNVLTRVEPIDACDVPLVDIAPLRDGTDAARVGAELHRAASEVGFLYIRNHGVDAAVVERARRAALAFFRLPEEAKREAGTNQYHHGYLKPGSTKMYDDARHDLKESFNWGIEPFGESGGNHNSMTAPTNALVGPNVWPAAMPELRTSVYPYFEAASACAEDLLRGFALGAGLDAEHFIRLRDRPVSRGSLQYYPPQSDGAEEDQFGVAPHTDFGLLTVLCQDEIGGLEIRLPDGRWAAMPPVPDTCVVNIGDLLERWSNRRYRSTVHRVINRSGRDRLSLVVAYDPNFETLVDPRAFCSEEEVPCDEPITCGDYLLWRFGKAFSYRRRDEGVSLASAD